MLTIYHNPKCSKSRATLALLEERGLNPEVVRYLETPPSEEMLKNILKSLGKRPRDIIRKGEDPYRTLGLEDQNMDDESLVKAMVAHPVLIERPIVVNGDKAAMGRPPEAVLTIL